MRGILKVLQCMQDKCTDNADRRHGSDHGQCVQNIVYGKRITPLARSASDITVAVTEDHRFAGGSQQDDGIGKLRQYTDREGGFGGESRRGQIRVCNATA